jgi:hypothetical protein
MHNMHRDNNVMSKGNTRDAKSSCAFDFSTVNNKLDELDEYSERYLAEGRRLNGEGRRPNASGGRATSSIKPAVSSQTVKRTPAQQKASPPACAAPPQAKGGYSSTSSGLSPAQQAAKTANISRMIGDHFKLSVEFELTHMESSMVSLPGRTKDRDEYFTELFAPLGRKIRIVDAYACIGGDSLAFLKWAGDNGIDMTLVMVQKDEFNRFERLKTHVTSFMKANRMDESNVVFLKMLVQDVVTGFLGSTRSVGAVDMLYLDPEWDLPEGFDLKHNKGTALEPSLATIRILGRLHGQVFEPLANVGAPPAAYICLKTPTPFEEFSVFLWDTSPYLRGYVFDKEIEVLRRPRVDGQRTRAGRNQKSEICMYFIFLRYKGTAAR